MPDRQFTMSADHDQSTRSDLQVSEGCFTVTLSVSPTRVMAVLSWTIVLLTAACAFTQAVFRFGLGHEKVYGLVPLFALTGELNISTWFSSGMLLLAAALLALIASEKTREGDPYRVQATWLAVAVMMMSIDEAVAIHERSSRLLKGFPLTGFLHHRWVVFGVIVVVVLALVFRGYLWSFPSRIRRRLFAAIFVYFSGALGFELVTGWVVSRYPTAAMTYTALATIENVLEMAGIAMFISALLQYLRSLTAVRAVV